MQTFFIDANELRALFAIADSADGSRFYLASIYAHDDKLTATDGQGALRIPCHSDLDGLILGLPPKPLLKRTERVQVVVDGEHIAWIELRAGDILLRRQESVVIAAKYPDLDSALPTTWSKEPAEGETFSFNPELFARATRHLSGTFQLRFPDEANKPYQMVLKDRPDALLVVMPMRW